MANANRCCFGFRHACHFNEKTPRAPKARLPSPGYRVRVTESGLPGQAYRVRLTEPDLLGADCCSAFLYVFATSAFKRSTARRTIHPVVHGKRMPSRYFSNGNEQSGLLRRRGTLIMSAMVVAPNDSSMDLAASSSLRCNGHSFLPCKPSGHS